MRKYLTNKKIYVIVFFVCVIGIIIFSIYQGFKTNDKYREGVAAEVNGEVIFANEIERVLSEYDDTDGITYDGILENTINELLLVQYGKRNGFIASKEEILEREEYLKNTMPDVYAEIEKNGIEDYRKNLENLIIYEKTKNDYLLQCSSEVRVSEEEAKKWYISNISVNMDGYEKNKDMIITKLEEEKIRCVVSRLVDELKEVSEIKIYER